MENDLKSGNSINPFKRLKMWVHGFESEKYYLYNFRNNNFKFYLSDYMHQKTKYLNFPYDIVLHNKILFEKIVSQYIRVARNYAFIEKGVIFPLQNEIEISTIDSIIEVCREEEGLMAKPIRGSQGRGISDIKITGNKIFMNSKELSYKEFRDYITGCDGYLITEHIKQDQYAMDLYPASTNTIRVLMMVDPDTHEPFIAAAAQRIGSKSTGCLDNFTLGGYSANVDLSTGELSAAVTKSDTLKKGRLIWHRTHPDTGLPIKGVKIPKWQKIKNKLVVLMKNLPYIKYVGLDVVVANDDIVIIEGNSYP